VYDVGVKRLLIGLLIALFTFLIGMSAYNLICPVARVMLVDANGSRYCEDVRICAWPWAR